MDRFVNRTAECEQLHGCYESSEAEFVVLYGRRRLGKSELVRQFVNVGQWWDEDVELDVLGLSRDGLVAGECKFTSSPIEEGVLADLERTTDQVRWGEAPTDGSPLFVLFSRAGYTDDLRSQAANRTDVHIFDLEDVL